MQDLEPYYRWRDKYIASLDNRSPYYGVEPQRNAYRNTVYNYYIHPEWDEIGSRTLFVKLLYADYRKHFAVIEMIGEWNDAIENDIMLLRKELTDPLMAVGIHKFLLIAENVLNFHSGDKDYYEDWYDAVSDENGWIVMLNMPESSKHDFVKLKLNYFIELQQLDDWRKYDPAHLYKKINDEQNKRLA